jgi:hypothetical protein
MALNNRYGAGNDLEESKNLLSHLAKTIITKLPLPVHWPGHSYVTHSNNSVKHS